MGDSGGAPDKSSNDLIMTTLLCRTYRQNSCSILKLCKFSQKNYANTGQSDNKKFWC